MKTVVQIKGMHCRSCEILIAEEIKKIPYVSKVDISFKQGQADIYSNKPISDEAVLKAVEKAGYSVGENKKKSLLSADFSTYKNIFISLFILGMIYAVIRALNLNLNFIATKNPTSLVVVLLLGLTAGVSTCMALVGGLILGVSARHAEKHPQATALQKFRPHLFFNLGRIGSYVLLGGVVGALGSAFQLSALSLGAITILVGLVMLVLGLQLTEISPRISSGGFTLPSGIAKLLGIKKHQEKEYSHKNAMILGTLTFFLPCGFTQAMQVYALSTGSFLSGALIMGTFALGTAPGLLGVGGLTSVMKGSFAKKFYAFAGVVVVALALVNLSNGSHLVGLKFPTFKASSSSNAEDSNVQIENGVQIVRMDQVSNGYKPNHFTIKANIPVKWIVNSKNQQSCAASLYSRDLNIGSYLSSGENVFEFTPTKAGEIDFSCSMGMYRGSFTVVESDATPLLISTQPPVTSAPTSTSGNQDAQVIKASYTIRGDIDPKSFEVNVNRPVRFEIFAKDNGVGCMGSVTIPGLVSNFYQFTKDQTVVFNFTPQKTGTYEITCAMGSPRGKIVVK